MANNIKAIAHFHNLGVKLLPCRKAAVVIPDTYCDGSGMTLTYSIYKVDVKMSGRQFHKYLVDHGLLSADGCLCDPVWNSGFAWQWLSS